jgi:hypothetical protein
MIVSEPETTQNVGRDDWFKTTHWSVVLGTRDNEPAAASEALGRLCGTYWCPSRQVLPRFGAERQALALMNHPNIAKVLDARFGGKGFNQMSAPPNCKNRSLAASFGASDCLRTICQQSEIAKTFPATFRVICVCTSVESMNLRQSQAIRSPGQWPLRPELAEEAGTARRRRR